MSMYYSVFGNTPALSLLELEQVAPQAQPTAILPQVAAFELSDDKSASELINNLGGTVKIAKHVTTTSHDETAIKAAILEALVQMSTDKVTFGIAEIGRDHVPVIEVSDIKDMVIEAGLKARYYEDSRTGLSASILLHKKSVVEIMVINQPEETIIAQTVAVQNIDEWSRRDREKPYFDRKKGMLPPKVARMMVNIGLGYTKETKPVVYDPFCGTGTVIMEALMAGAIGIGSDSDAAAVAGAQENLRWLQKTTPEIASHKVEIFKADVSQARPSQPVTTIVTEPFLGKPTPQITQLPNIYRGLEKLYIGAFKNWTRLLVDGGVVVVVLPVVETERRRFDLSAFVDKLSSIGYTTLHSPLLYKRPQAIVQREIHFFRYNKV